MSRYLYRVEWPIRDDTRTLPELEAEAQRSYLLMAAALTSAPSPRLLPAHCAYCGKPRRPHAPTCRTPPCLRAHDRARRAQRNARRRAQHAQHTAYPQHHDRANADSPKGPEHGERSAGEQPPQDPHSPYEEARPGSRAGSS